jgi:hypothetical protein
MTVQYSVAIQNARLDAVETTAGVGPILELRTGAVPASAAAAASGTVVATMQLPNDWMGNAALGTKTKSGTWEDIAADADGTIGHFRIWDSTKTTCHIQGTVSATSAGGDMTVDNPIVKAGQDILVNTFSLTSGNR